MPACDLRHQVGGGLGVDGGKGFVQQDHLRVLQQKPSEQHPLHLPARQRADRAPVEPGQTHGGQCVGNAVGLCGAYAAERADFRP